MVGTGPTELDLGASSDAEAPAQVENALRRPLIRKQGGALPS